MMCLSIDSSMLRNTYSIPSEFYKWKDKMMWLYLPCTLWLFLPVRIIWGQMDVFFSNLYDDCHIGELKHAILIKAAHYPLYIQIVIKG